MKKYILGAFASVLLMQNVSAEMIPPNPSVCPSVSAIQGVGVSTNTLQISQFWVAGRRNQTYGTGFGWTFLLGNIHATDQNDAYVKATAALSNLFLEVGPFYDSFTNRWLCIYGTQTGYPALTANPPLVTLYDEHLSRYLQ